MVMTYRDEKGSPLTSAEVDANFRDVVSKNVTTDNKAQTALDTANNAKNAAQAAQEDADAAGLAAGNAQTTADAAAQAAIDAANNANGRQPSSDKLSAIAASVWAANQLLITTGANSLAMLTTGATGRALITADTPAVGRTALALGTAATGTVTTSATDNTAGRILKVGDGGLLGVAADPSNGTWLGNRFVQWQAASTDKPAAVAGASIGLDMGYAENRRAQLLVTLADAGSRMFFRGANSAATSSNFWRELIAQGDYGVGGYGVTVLSTSINTLVASGWYYCNSANGGENLPVAVNGFLTVHAQSSLYCKQTFSHVTDGRTWERYLVNGTWQPWDQLLKRSNMIQGSYDGAADRIVTTGASGVGWMGLGAASIPAVANLNTITPTCFYTFNDTAVGRPAQFGYGNVLTISRAANEATQIAFSVVSPSSTIRQKLNGTWTEWAVNYNSQNVVGSVSASGSTNTGAIIERGTGGLGHWVRYADGTLDMWGVSAVTVPQSTAPIPVNAAVALPFNFVDTSFITVAHCQPHTTWTGVGGVAFCSAGSTSYFNAQVINTSASQTMNIYWRSIGRWRNA